jgi:putative endonuclease
MTNFRQHISKLGEDLACEFLVKNGFKIQDRNFKCKLGEIDIVAMKNKVVHFVEVKTRTTTIFGDPENSVTIKKQKKIILTSKIYSKYKNFENFNYQFDVISILSPLVSKKIQFFENAFELKC